MKRFFHSKVFKAKVSKQTPNISKKSTPKRLALSTIAKGIALSKTFSKPPQTPKSQFSKHKKWVLFFILTLVILPSLPTPAQANVFEPIIKVLLPFYERIVGKEDIIKQKPTEVDDVPKETNTAPAPITPSNSPTPDLLTLLQAEFAADRDDPATALQLYKGEALKDNATAVFERALGLSMQYESFDQSLAFAKQWQDKNSDHVPVWFYVTHLAIKAEDYRTAAQNIKLILAYDPNADLSQIFTGILPNTRPAQRALFTELQAIDSEKNPSLSALKSGLLMQLNEPIPAILHLDNAINADKNNLAYYILKADILKATDEYALDEFLRHSVKVTTGDTQKELYLYHAHHLLEKGDLTRAYAVLKSTGKRLDQDSELMRLASLVALDLEDYDEANRLLLNLSSTPENQSEAYYYLGLSHERTQNYRSALAYFAKVNDMQYVLPAVKKQVAYELLFDNPDGAIQSLINLRQNFEMYASDSYTLHAEILTRLGKADEARALLDKAYQEYPDDPTVLYARIQLMDDDAEYDAKMSAIKSLLDFEPDNPSYQLALAKLLLHKSPNDTSALDIVQSISQTGLDNPEYNAKEQLNALLILANYAYKQGDYQAVIEQLQAPYELSPDLEVGTLLLRAYQKLGDKAKVQSLLAELQDRFGNHTQAQNQF